MAEDVKIEINVEGNAEKVIKTLTSSLKNFGDTTESSLKKSTSAFDVFQGALGAGIALKAFDSIVAGAKKLFDVFVVQGVQAAADYEVSLNQLQVALANTGLLTQQTSNEFEAFASNIQKTTKFSDDQVLSTAALIQNMAKLDKDGLQQATKGAIELSAALGISLDSAATLVGKSANGNIETFGKYGLAVKKGATDTETFANALKAIGGLGQAAEGQLLTFDGAVTKAGNAFQDLQKSIGQLITQNPAINAAINTFSVLIDKVTESLGKSKGPIQDFINNFVIAIVTSGPALLNTFVAITNTLATGEQILRGFAYAAALVHSGLLSVYSAIADFTGLDSVSNVLDGIIEKEQAFLLVQEEKIIQLQKEKEARAIFQEETLASLDEFNAAFIEKVNNTNVQQVQLKNNTNAQLKAADVQLSEFEKKTNKQKVDDLAKVFGDISTLSKSNNKDLFYVGQAAAVAQATIQGYQAVAFALGSAPPPFNFALAALVGVASAANVANILSTSPPALATGASFVDGQNGVDKIPAFLSRGERVFTTEQNKDFSRFLASEGNNASILGAIFDRLGSLESGVIVNIGGKSLVKTLNDEIAAGQVINV